MGARDRNWWDLPYHFLMDLKGTIYEGRDYHFMGETNTAYDPRGHFLISIIGTCEEQEPTPAQVAAIADLMAWAFREFNLPLDRLGGHCNYARQHVRESTFAIPRGRNVTAHDRDTAVNADCDGGAFRKANRRQRHRPLDAVG